MHKRKWNDVTFTNNVTVIALSTLPRLISASKLSQPAVDAPHCESYFEVSSFQFIVGISCITAKHSSISQFAHHIRH